ncbi:MAG: mechanosensitive ion channel family protein [Sulfurovum sp.]|nr:MAG: mechanosensitive ion channel family protein [Sulfurovum sp.]
MKLFFILSILLYQIISADSNVTVATVTNELNISSLESNTVNEIAREKLEEEIKAKQAEAQKVAYAKKLAEIQKRRLKEEEERQILEARLTELMEEKDKIDNYLTKDNLWNRVYSNHETYQLLTLSLSDLSEKISDIKKKYPLSQIDKNTLKSYEEGYTTIKNKLSLLEDYKDNPFESMVKPPKIDEIPPITNPIDIITALSFEKQVESINDDYKKRYKTLDDAVAKLTRKSEILQEMVLKTRGEIYNNYVKELRNVENKLIDFKKTRDYLRTIVEIFDSNVSQMKFTIKKGITDEIKKSIYTGSIILFLLLVFLIIKYLVKKYMSENELYYGTNKVINFIFIALVFIILLFSYLEDVHNLVTVLGFASAGIAIALKDWFMSIIGWFVILISGSIHVGDRVKFVKDGFEYVGDIVDISILRITLHEDVTLTSVYKNRRTGRIIFIPNNYIFTDMIANYSHAGLKTVWDGIDFYVTFDSNILKAQQISKEVTRKYSKGYTDMTRKQLNRLRSKYSMRNTAVEPRIFGFMDTYGVRISAWYLTNAYATLTLRSTISMEILSKLKEADDIFLAYPSQSLYIDKPAPKNLKEEEEPPLPPTPPTPTGKYKPDDWGLY